MIRAFAHRPDGTPVVLLGLDAENRHRLINDQPIEVNLAHLDPDPAAEPTGLPDITVVIFDAENREAVEYLKARRL